jgi:hypothetical protein
VKICRKTFLSVSRFHARRKASDGASSGRKPTRDDTPHSLVGGWRKKLRDLQRFLYADFISFTPVSYSPLLARSLPHNHTRPEKIISHMNKNLKFVTAAHGFGTKKKPPHHSFHSSPVASLRQKFHFLRCWTSFCFSVEKEEEDQQWKKGGRGGVCVCAPFEE